jgi:mannan endo-1,4-beta-mannosidase
VIVPRVSVIAGLVAVALLGLSLAPARAEMIAEAPPPPTQPFVSVSGTHFMRNGSPFRFLGANVAVTHGASHRAALQATLDEVSRAQLSVIRVWALGERPEGAPPWARDFAFRVGEEGWIEESFVHLDHVLAEASARRLSVIVVLGNRWADYGGVPQYLRWAGEPFAEGSSEGVPRSELGTFFRSERARALYAAHVDRVVSRVSSVTGIAYRDDPTIFAWELMNEVSAERRDAEDLRAWIREMAGHVRAIDSHHLVSAGHIGFVRAAERRTWLEVASMPEIDFADAHAYPAEWDRVRTMRELDAYVDDHVALAHRYAHKPFVWGEYGFSGAHAALRGSRARLFDAFLDRSEASGVDGSLAWVFSASADAPRSHAILVDSADASSLRVEQVIAEHAHAIGSCEAIDGPLLASATERLWEPSRTFEGTTRVARPRTIDGIPRVRLAPSEFFRARFESGGMFDGGAVAHVYGSGHGYVTYRFRAPRQVGDAIRVSMRASSELPGPGIGARETDGSHVEIAIDDQLVGSLDVPPDDGIGHRVETTITTSLAAGTTHTLTLRVPDDDDARGLCLYGAATGHEVLPPEILAELPGVLEIAFLP